MPSSVTKVLMARFMVNETSDTFLLEFLRDHCGISNPFSHEYVDSMSEVDKIILVGCLERLVRFAGSDSRLAAVFGPVARSGLLEPTHWAHLKSSVKEKNYKLTLEAIGASL